MLVAELDPGGGLAPWNVDVDAAAWCVGLKYGEHGTGLRGVVIGPSSGTSLSAPEECWDMLIASCSGAGATLICGGDPVGGGEGIDTQD